MIIIISLLFKMKALSNDRIIRRLAQKDQFCSKEELLNGTFVEINDYFDAIMSKFFWVLIPSCFVIVLIIAGLSEKIISDKKTNSEEELKVGLINN